MDFEQELEELINSYSQENVSNTPDFILAAYIKQALDAFNSAIIWRDKWWGIHLDEGNMTMRVHE